VTADFDAPPSPVSVEYESQRVIGFVWKSFRKEGIFLFPAGYQTVITGCPSRIGVPIPTELSVATYMCIFLD
jgi:hypothetical protein